MGAEVAQLVESSAPDQRAQVRDSPGEKPPYMLMALGAYKIRRGCNVLQVTAQILPQVVPKWGSHVLCGD